jgi:hypothetical protein
VLARWCMPPLGVNASSSTAATAATQPAALILPAAQTAALAMVSHHPPPPLDLGPVFQQGASGPGSGLLPGTHVAVQGQIQPPTGFPQLQVSNIVPVLDNAYCSFCCECAVWVNRQFLHGFESLLCLHRTPPALECTLPSPSLRRCQHPIPIPSAPIVT